MAENLLTPGVVLPQVGRYDLKSLAPKLKLGGDGELFSTQKTRLWSIKEATWGLPRPGSRPTCDGLRHNTSWIPGSFLRFLLWFCNTQLQKKGTWVSERC